MAPFSYLCLFSLFFGGIVAFDWATSSPGDKTVLQACVGEKVSFPWKFSLSEDETVMNVEWYKQTDGDLEIIAADLNGSFLKLPSAKFSVEFLPNAGIAISNFTFTDLGTYGVKVKYLVRSTLFADSRSVQLQLPDAPVLKENLLEGRIEQELVTNDATGERHLHLSCGTFLQLGSRPLTVEWLTPENGNTPVASTFYSDGSFHLTLPNPVVGGTYVCRLTDPSVVARCVRHMSASLRHGDYVVVDEVKARLQLLEGGLTDLTSLRKEFTSDLEHLRQQQANQTQADEDLRTELQTELSNVKKLKSELSDILELKEFLQFAALQWRVQVEKVNESCLNNRFQSSCYAVLDPSDWFIANEKCKLHGGRLTEISSAEERDHVKTLAVQWGEDSYWLGGTDEGSEGTWRWSGTGDELSFTDWVSGEPNNTPPGGEHCMEMGKKLNWQWNDNKCAKIQRPICQFR